jgi:hypothetical protein
MTTTYRIPLGNGNYIEFRDQTTLNDDTDTRIICKPVKEESEKDLKNLKDQKDPEDSKDSEDSKSQA